MLPEQSTTTDGDRTSGARIPSITFYVGDWFVDPASSSLSKDNDLVRLEPKVMDLLVELAREPGKVVTREHLEQTVWAGTVVSYDVLSSSVLKLRKALDDSTKEPRYIETIPKKGYRLIAPVRRASGEEIEGSSATSPSRRQYPRSFQIGVGVVFGMLLVLVIVYFLYVEQDETVQSELQGSQVSIVILPFRNLGTDSQDDYFVDGFTNDLTTDLTRLSGLFVISRDSAFVYKNSTSSIKEIAAKLQVRYVLQGSVRRQQDRIRINAALIDAGHGTNIWAERYDGNTDDIFKLQDEISSKIISALAVKLTPAERQSLIQVQTQNMAAYNYFLHGLDHFFRYSRDSNREARNFFQKAIDLDANFARAWAMLGWTHAFDFMNGWSDVPAMSLQFGEQFASKAMNLEKDLPVAYFVRGLVYRESGDYVKALQDADQAVRLDPSYANGYVLQATLLYYAGRPQEGLQKIQRAIRLNPHHPFNYPFHLGQAYFVLKRYPEAIAAFQRGLESNPSSERLQVWLAASLAKDHQLDEAQWRMEQIKLVNPDISLARQESAFPFKDKADLDNFIDGLRQAGLTK